MRYRIGLPLSFLLLGPVTGSELPTAPHPDPDAWRQLADSIQQRFLNIGVFGMNRILPAHGIRQFGPESAQEREAVDQLEQKGYEVALYLAGRGILGASEPTPNFRRGVQGPAFITHVAHPEDLPQPAALLPQARKALASFETAQGYDLRIDDWDVRVRPLRASGQVCVQCHVHGSGGANPNLKIGDALGVVMYVSRASVARTPTASN